MAVGRMRELRENEHPYARVTKKDFLGVGCMQASQGAVHRGLHQNDDMRAGTTDVPSRYQVLKRLGEGSFGYVVAGQ